MSITDEAFRFVCELVRKEASIELSSGKEYLVSSRLGVVVKEQGVESVEALIDGLRLSPTTALKQKVVEALTTNETLFFRDGHPFDALKKTILPSIIERRRPFRSLRILSAACSTGQEPYTLAMILFEHFPELKNWSLEMVATDFNEKVLERAREGKYRQIEVSRGLPAVYLAKYFKRRGAEWQLDEGLRKLITFRQQNITAPWRGVGRYDLVLLRNVLIYFSTSTKTFVLRQAASALDPQGVLLLGAAENTLGLDVPLEKIEVGATSAYHRKEIELKRAVGM